MLRIIVREVSDVRLRSPKSLAIADIEPFVILPRGSPLHRKGAHLATLYLSDPAGEKKIAAVQFLPSVSPSRDLWQYILEALLCALPKGQANRTPKPPSAPGTGTDE